MSERTLALVASAVLACLAAPALGQPADAKKDEKAQALKDVYKKHFLIGTAGDLPGNYSA